MTVRARTDVICRPIRRCRRPTTSAIEKPRPPAANVPDGRYLPGDKGYQAGRRHRPARGAGALPVLPGQRNRKRAIRYDKLTADFQSGVARATALTFWL
jgi:hypothetical protein